MCDMTACTDTATHYVVVKAVSKPLAADQTKRVEVCREHLGMAHKLADAQLTKLVEYGPLDKAWRVHPGGK